MKPFSDPESVLAFLRLHPSMPSEVDSTAESDEQYDALFDFLDKHPDEQCTRLLIRSLSPLSRPSLCQRISDVLCAHNHLVRESLIGEALHSESPWVREWAVAFAAEFPSLHYLPLFRSLLRAAETKEETALNVVTALEASKNSFCSAEADEIIRSDFENSARWKALHKQMRNVARAEKRLALERVRLRAESAFQGKDYATVVDLLEPHRELLAPVLLKKLAYAKQKRDLEG